MKIRERYQKRVDYLLRKYKIGRYDLPLEMRGCASAHFGRRDVHIAPPVDALNFFIACHEIAHIILDHRYMDWGLSEIEADVWALMEIKRLRGWIPCTISRRVARNAAQLMTRAITNGRISAEKIVEKFGGKT
jgi:hypothetical protein